MSAINPDSAAHGFIADWYLDQGIEYSDLSEYLVEMYGEYDSEEIDAIYEAATKELQKIYRNFVGL